MKTASLTEPRTISADALLPWPLRSDASPRAHNHRHRVFDIRTMRLHHSVPSLDPEGPDTRRPSPARIIAHLVAAGSHPSVADVPGERPSLEALRLCPCPPTSGSWPPSPPAPAFPRLPLDRYIAPNQSAEDVAARHLVLSPAHRRAAPNAGGLTRRGSASHSRPASMGRPYVDRGSFVCGCRTISLCCRLEEARSSRPRLFDQRRAR